VAGIADAGMGERADQAGGRGPGQRNKMAFAHLSERDRAKSGNRIMKPIGRYKLARAFQQVSTRCGGVW
jgi:hypothetical protein